MSSEDRVARGEFEVEMTPRPDDEPSVGRMLLDKRYRGDLDATGVGQMLSHRSPVDGSAGYVALEHVTGTLAGRSGGFVLQHSGRMDRGVPSLSVTVVPDSGSGELIGLVGDLDIEVADGSHRYVLRYRFEDRTP